jgi:hypothetical protein
MAACERLLTDSEDRNCEFLIKLFQKQLQRLNQLLDQFIVRFLFSSVTTRNDAETLDLRFLSCPGRSSQGYRGNEAHNKEEERSRSLCQAFPRSFAFPSLKCFSLILSPPKSPLTSLSLSPPSFRTGLHRPLRIPARRYRRPRDPIRRRWLVRTYRKRDVRFPSVYGEDGRWS